MCHVKEASSPLDVVHIQIITHLFVKARDNSSVMTTVSARSCKHFLGWIAASWSDPRPPIFFLREILTSVFAGPLGQTISDSISRSVQWLRTTGLTCPLPPLFCGSALESEAVLEETFQRWTRLNKPHFLHFCAYGTRSFHLTPTYYLVKLLEAW